MLIRNAIFSECGRYRYALSHCWDASLEPCMFLMLNPSTADALVDDPTIRRCGNFARSWGMGGMFIGNVFAWRSSNPAELYRAIDPVGPGNLPALRWMAAASRFVVAAWGAWPDAEPEASHALSALPVDVEVKAFARTASGAPRHPLYLRRDAELGGWHSAKQRER